MLRAALHLALLAEVVTGTITLNEFATVDLPNAAVASFAPSFLGTDGDALLVTTFSPTTDHDSVLMMTRLAELKAGDTNETIVTTLDGEAVWPNQASPVPEGTVASLSTPTALQAGGFFVKVPGSPSKADGTVDLLVADSSEASTFTKQTISSYKKDNFYHHAEWLDMNDDGRLDVVAARCYEPQYFGSPDSELIWIEQPEDGGEWETHVVYSNGPDVAFTVVDLDGDGSSQIIATEFFVNQRLALYKCAGASWSECDTDSTEVVVIDETEGVFFDLQWVDLNLDGVKDLLVTTQGTNGKGKVLAYEVPSKWGTEAWIKHELADGYAPLHSYLPGQGSPGAARAFSVPDLAPHIIVTADDGGFVDMLVPTETDFEYEKVTVIESTGTVGSPATGDVDGDGVVEVFVPLYDESRLAMYEISGL